MRVCTAVGLSAIAAALMLSTSSADEIDNARLLEAFGQLQPTFTMVPLAPASVRRGSGSLVAFANISFTHGGTGVIELHRDASGIETIWVAVPDTAWRREHPPIGFYGWHGFERSGEGTWIEQQRPGLASPPRFPADRDVPPMLSGSGIWARWDEYYDEAFWRGDDPPHWSPIAIWSGGAPWIGDIHEAMNSGRHAEAAAQIDRMRPRRGDDLTDRAMETWQPVTLRGAVVGAEFTGGDLGVDHTYAYHVDGRTFHPSLLDGEFHDPRWPGLDWDVKVSPDRDVRYLLSDRTSGDPYWNDVMELEIEHFAISSAYRPVRGDWLQATGRWITDNGHGFRTEIHPPELVVSSRHGPGAETVARVVATGAWLGEDLSFVVYPPKRPSPQARLRYEFTSEPLRRVNLDVPVSVGQTLRQMITGPDSARRAEGAALLEFYTMLLDAGALPASLVRVQDGAPLDIGVWPADNPNHLICTLRANSDDYVVLHNSGSVSMTSASGHTSRIHVWWEDRSAELSGVIRSTGGAPALGASLYYREAGTPETPWLSVDTDNAGRYQIPRLNTEVTYEFRPAGSGWDFRIPRPIARSFTGGTATINFTADASSLAALTSPVAARIAPLDPLSRLRHPEAAAFGPPAEAPDRGESIDDQMRRTALEMITGRAFAVAGPGELGVRSNGFGSPDRGRIVVSLASLIGADGGPVPSLNAAYEELAPELRDAGRHLGIDTASLVPAIRLRARAGAGVAGAVIRATLLLGNRRVGFRQIGPVGATTNPEGLAVFRVEAGTHAEDMLLQVEVATNPANPWFLPKLTAAADSLGPAATGDDFVPPVGYRLVADVLPSMLQIGFDPKRIKAPLPLQDRAVGDKLVRPLPFPAATPTVAAQASEPPPPEGWEAAQKLIDMRREFLAHDLVVRTSQQTTGWLDPLPGKRVILDQKQLDAVHQRLLFAGASGLAAPPAGSTPGVSPTLATKIARLPPIPSSPPVVASPKPSGGGAGAEPSGTRAAGPVIVVGGAMLGSIGSVSGGSLTPERIPPSGKDPNGVPYLRWSHSNVESRARFEVTAASAGSYTLYVSFLKTPDGLPIAVSVNGIRAGTPFDPSGDSGVAKISFGRVELHTGANEIAFEFEAAGAKERPLVLGGVDADSSATIITGAVHEPVTLKRCFILCL